MSCKSSSPDASSPCMCIFVMACSGVCLNGTAHILLEGDEEGAAAVEFDRACMGLRVLWRTIMLFLTTRDALEELAMAGWTANFILLITLG